MTVTFRQVGLLINGVEFVPQDIVDNHLPFAAPPDATVEAVYVREEAPSRRGAKPNADGCQSRLRGRWGVAAKCRLPAGHDGDRHTNGYRSWTEPAGPS